MFAQLKKTINCSLSVHFNISVVPRSFFFINLKRIFLTLHRESLLRLCCIFRVIFPATHEINVALAYVITKYANDFSGL